MPFSDYVNQAMGNSLFGKTSNFGTLASRPTLYLGLSSTLPTQAGANVTEPSAGAYARVATAPSDWNSFTAANPAVSTNATLIAFAQATAQWLGGANLAYAVLYDALTAGNFIARGALVVPKAVNINDIPRFPIDTITISFAPAV